MLNRLYILTLILGGCKQIQGLLLPTEIICCLGGVFLYQWMLLLKTFLPVMHNCWRLLSKKECIGGISFNGLNNVSGCFFLLVFSSWHSEYFMYLMRCLVKVIIWNATPLNFSYYCFTWAVAASSASNIISCLGL